MTFASFRGLVTEASWQSWTEAELDPYLQIALTAFGPERIKFGSDWPVILLGSSYKRWVSIVQRVVSQLSEYEQERILGKTAKKFIGSERDRKYWENTFRHFEEASERGRAVGVRGRSSC